MAIVALQATMACKIFGILPFSNTQAHKVKRDRDNPYQNMANAIINNYRILSETQIEEKHKGFKIKEILCVTICYSWCVYCICILLDGKNRQFLFLQCCLLLAS